MARPTRYLHKLYGDINFLRKKNCSLICESNAKLPRLGCPMHVKAHTIIILIHSVIVIRGAASL